MTAIRWLLAIPLAVLFVIVAAANWSVVIAMARERLRWRRGGDLHGVKAIASCGGCGCLPGGVAGAIAMLLCPIPGSYLWAWVPLVLDPSLLPRIVLHSTLEAPWHSAVPEPPLHAAAAAGDATAVRERLDAGDSPNRFWLWTPLHYAARADAADMVDLLLARGADPSPADYRGRTPADVAEMAGHHNLAVSLRHAEGDPPRYGAPMPFEEALAKLIEAAEGGEWCRDVLLAVRRPDGREVGTVLLQGDGRRVECRLRRPWQDTDAAPAPAMARMVGQTKDFGETILIDGEARPLGPEPWPVSFEPKSAQSLPTREGLPLEFSDLYRIDRTARNPKDVEELMGWLHDAGIADDRVHWDPDCGTVSFEARRTAHIPRGPNSEDPGRRTFVTIRDVIDFEWLGSEQDPYIGQLEEAHVEEDEGLELMLDFVAAHARLRISTIDLHVRDTTELYWPPPQAGPQFGMTGSAPPDEIVTPV